MKNKINIGIYSILVCLIIGIITAAYLNLINWLIQLVWSNYLKQPQANWIYPFMVCVPFGLIIGFLNKKLGNYPLTIEEVLEQVRSQGKINYHNWWKSILLGLLALSGGASIGPEASTTVLTGSMINWLGDRIRWATKFKRNIWLRRMDSDELKQSPNFTNLFKKKWQSKITIIVLTIIGILGAALVFKLFPEEGVFGIHHRTIHWAWINLATAAPTLVIGFLFGWLFIKLENWFAVMVNVRGGKIFQALIFGFLLALTALFSKDVMFSGEFRIVPFTEQTYSFSIIYLIILAFLKAVMSNLGFVMGWRGGTIFPAIFASLALGIAAARVLPGDPRINAVIVLTASVTVILGKPILTTILLMLLVSIELTPVILVVSLLTNFVRSKIFKQTI